MIVLLVSKEVGILSKWKKIARITAIILICNLVVSFVTTKMIYDSIFRRYDTSDSTASSSLRAIMQPVSFPSGENMLSGRFFDSPGDSLVVIVQGIHSHAGNFIPVIERLVFEDNRDVFIFDMTGSCESEGESAIGFSQAIYDLNAALDYVDSAYDYEDILLLGHSRGGYAACCVLPGRTDIDGVVAVNSPNSPMDAVIGSSVNAVGWLAYGNYPMLFLYQSMLFDFDTVSKTAADAIVQSDVPVLIIQSVEDETVRWDQFSIYSHKDEINEEQTLFILTTGEHSSVLYHPSDTIWEPIQLFFQNCEN